MRLTQMPPRFYQFRIVRLSRPLNFRPGSGRQTVQNQPELLIFRKVIAHLGDIS